MIFSRRLPDALDATELSQTLEASKGAIDLTLSNPTVCGFAYPEEALRTAMAPKELTHYRPDPLGLASAREAIATHLGSLGHVADPRRLVLSASTSEAYGYLFKLLCNPGERIATPAPSYPLIEHLAALEALETLPYRLQLVDGVWRLDCDSVREVLDEGARVLVVISPNNPTGHVVGDAEAACLRELCTEYGVALVSDEVFSPYGPGGARAPSLGDGGDEGPLTFVLDGLSKAAGLPQLKLAWTRVSGPRTEVEAAIARLEWIADAYLSVGNAVQLAVPTLLEHARSLQAQVNERLERNRQGLRQALDGVACAHLQASTGGWYGVIALPCEHDEEQLVARLAERHGVLVHPGYFYDFLDNGHLVLSLLPPEDDFRRGAERLAAALRTLDPGV